MAWEGECMTGLEPRGAGTTPGAGDILQIFRDGRARTKAELVQLTGLARSTVSQRVDALLGAGWIVPAGEAASSGGRPPARLAFGARSRSVIAVDLGAAHGLLAVCDLSGEVVRSVRSGIDIASGPEPVLEWVVDAATECAEAASGDVGAPLAVGIGLPGPVEHSTGRPTKPPIMPGWDGFDVPGFIGERLGVPVLVDNDVNILALGEQATVWPETDDLLFVKVSTGIGAGIVSGGFLRRGAQGAAGDIGHVRVPASSSSPRDPLDDRDLEALAGGTALARALSTPERTLSTSADVVALLRRGEPAAVDAVRQAGREVGEVIATAVNLLNPSVVVIGGSIGNTGEHLLAGVREIVYGRSTPLATQHLSIVQSRAGSLGGAIGAAHMAIEHVLAPERIGSATPEA